MYYKLLLDHITIFFIISHLTECQETGVSLRSATPLYLSSKEQLADSVQCPLWFFYNSTTKQCECYNIYPETVTCTKQRAFLHYNNYMTYSEEKGLFISNSYYYDASGLNRSASQPGFIELPSNISELNDYMCGSANRKGFLCSECIDGFGPSATSPKFKCMNCSNIVARYSVTIYLLSELVPVTIFYFIVLFFQINLTSAPMVNFIFYSQVVHNTISYNGIDTLDQMKYSLSIASVFHGIWNLNYFRYVIPPFCISQKFHMIHIVYLQSISTFFPFVLIGITWICIELYTSNCILLLWSWKAINKLFLRYVKLMKIQNRTVTVVDTFATFFLLSYSKLILFLSLSGYSTELFNVNDTTLASSHIHRLGLDPTEDFLGKSHATVAIMVIIFLMFILPPVVLLALYPVRAFRSLLFKCCSTRCMASLTIFVEKFYSCYRDGLDGGWDMRSWASVPFILVLIGFSLSAGVNHFFYLFSVFSLCWCLVTAVMQPYKEKFMTLTDMFIFTNVSILSASLNVIITYSDASHIYQNTVRVFGTLPMIWLVGFVFYKIFKIKIKISLNMAREKLPRCCNLLNCGNQNEPNNPVQHVGDFNDFPDPDRMLYPAQYMQCGYDSIS